MYLSIWQRLGISKTRSEDAIRSAYVRAVQQCHPEDKPEEWALLHDAYLQALQYARGEPAQSYYDPQKSQESPERDNGPDPEYSEDFRAALLNTQETASRVIAEIQKLKRKPSAISSKQVRPLTEMLFKLNPFDESDREAASEALHFFSSKMFTREAYDVIFHDLQEWSYDLSHTGLKAEIRETIRKVKQLLETAKGKGAGWQDALFALAAAVTCMIILHAREDEGSVFLIILLLFSFGTIYRLKSKQMLYIPSEKRSRGVWRVILALGLVIVIISSLIGCRHFALQGIDPIYAQVEYTYYDFNPMLDKGASVSLSLTKKPVLIGQFIKSIGSGTSNNKYPTVSTQVDYYYATGANGQSALICVEVPYTYVFSDLKMPCTIYGQVADLDTDGSLLPMKIPGLVSGDPEDVINSMLEDLDASRKKLTETAEEIGGHPVFRYTASEPGTRNVLIGYEPGRTPYAACCSVCLGCSLYLILMMSRSVSLKKKLLGEN